MRKKEVLFFPLLLFCNMKGLARLSLDSLFGTDAAELEKEENLWKSQETIKLHN